MKVGWIPVLGWLAVIAIGCEAPGSSPAPAPGAQDSAGEAGQGTEPPAFPTVHEAFLTPMDTLDNVDSPAAWRSPDGEDVLLKPYGVTGVEEDGVLHLWVTDDFDVTGEGEARWENRVKRFAVDLNGGVAGARFQGMVGESAGPCRLTVVESILADPAHDRLFIADEDEAERVIKVYDLEGSFTGRRLGEGVFAAEPEGIALYACGEDGYLLMADQSPEGNRFQVFDRASLDHLGTFAGETVTNTDGVALLQGPVGNLGSGAFYAVHDDQGVVGFRWADVAEALGLRRDCEAR